MIIPWKLKSKIFYLIELFHFHSSLKFIQKYVTKKRYNLSITRSIKFHQKNILDNKLNNGTLLEIGAGSSLFQNIFLSNSINEQILIDKHYLLDYELINYSIEYLLENGINLKNKEKINDLSDLKRYGIYYNAPTSLSEMKLKSESIDIFVSTNTFEHIPKDNLTEILKEAFRLLKNNGLASIKIDYKDHYSYSDKSISGFNFLNYSDQEWKKYNHQNHYQNRLRHFEYVEIFQNIGFSIIKEKAFYSQKDIDPKLKTQYLDKSESWCATEGLFLLRK